MSSSMNDWAKYHIAVSRNWKLLSMHTVDLFIQVSGHNSATTQPGLSISSDARKFATQFLDNHCIDDCTGIVGLHTGASTEEKQWPLSYFLRMSKILLETDPSLRIICYGTEKVKPHADYLRKYLGDGIIDATGKTDIMQLAALLEKTDVLVSNDTGPMHLAAACGTRVVSIHTGKERCITTGPYGPGHIAIEPNIACHPCERPDKCHSRECGRLILSLIHI